MTVQAAYVGNISNKLFYQRELNPARLEPGATTADTNLRRVFNQPNRNGPDPVPYAAIGLFQSTANSNYHARTARCRLESGRRMA